MTPGAPSSVGNAGSEVCVPPKALLWRVSEDNYAVAEPGYVQQLELRRRVEALEEVLALADPDGRNQEMELVDQPVPHQRRVERPVAVLHDVSARFLLQHVHVCGDVPFNDSRVPGGLA